MAIGIRLKPDIYFFLRWLRLMLLLKECYSDSLSGYGSTTKPFD